MRRALALLLPLVLAGCDAGNRAAPGSDNAARSPVLRVSAPYERQQVVPEGPDGAVLALFDLQGATWGVGAGSRLRWRLDTGGKQGAWQSVADPTRAVSLGKLAVRTTPDDPYVLTVQALRPDGTPWTATEAGKDGAPGRTVNPEATVVRRFTVHAAWTAPAH